ncbi:MAG: DUF5706 domain-containing protein [Pseudomonadota bacterium]|nr:DUF5706 domain-containing protein [Pseudomonadota bacterium]
MAEKTNADASSPKFSTNAIYLARTAQVNTLTLSQMADQKASILIGATFVVFSLSVTKLIGTQVTWSMVALALTAFIASLFAVLSVLPTAKASSLDDPELNLLFFSNFARLEEEEWLDRLVREFQDDEAVLRLMMRDVHQNGRVLYQRKFRFLTLAYRAFLAGLLVTIVIFLAENAGALSTMTA